MNSRVIAPCYDALRAALALSHVPGAGPALWQALHQQFGSALAIMNAGAEALRACGVKPTIIAGIVAPDWAKVDQDLKWHGEDRMMVSIDHPSYPPLLRETPAPPLVLFVKGNISVLSKPQIALVGSRTPTTIGCEHAFAFAKTLAHDLVITSGLALGIDGASHRGALASQGKTIAVMGTGLDMLYPRDHRELAHAILDSGGAWVSEFSPKVGPSRHHFPQRNRIIAGLTLGVVVIEAALKSGSLITARYAAEAGRDVFAVPGSIHNPAARGCHHLIKQGALLVQTVQDILQELRIPVKTVARLADQALPASFCLVKDALSLRVLSHVQESTTSVDAIIAATGLPASTVASVLFTLSLQGFIKNVPGGVQATVKKYQAVDLQ